jgi:heat shock protein HtpX
MAMDFWEAQRRARSKTSLYVIIFCFLTLAVAVMVEVAMRTLAQESYDPPVPLLGMAFAGITFMVAGVQYLQFCAFGGSYVAESVGARSIDPDSKNPYKRRLLNIVEEIAVASSLPMPKVYVLDTPQINAFAAGLGKDDAAITVTTGCLNLLNRDELQGVIAHEFGHIYNKDMKISMRLAAMVMGFFFILYFAMRIMQFSSYREDRSQDRDNKGNPVMIAALILAVAGAFTWLFGSILKAAVSREREYLADACAVQFTRNPAGIANALRKIASEAQHDEMPSEGMAISHMYFDDRGALSALFATHPPIEKRIAAIEGRAYIPEEWNIPKP